MRLSKISGACFTWHSLWVWMLDKATTTTTTSKSSSLPQLMSMDGYIKHLLFVFVATIFPPPHSRVVCCVCAWPTDVLQVCFYVDGWTQLRGNVSDWPIPHFFQYTPNTLKYKFITTIIHHYIAMPASCIFRCIVYLAYHPAPDRAVGWFLFRKVF